MGRSLTLDPVEVKREGQTEAGVLLPQGHGEYRRVPTAVGSHGAVGDRWRVIIHILPQLFY